MCERKMHQRCCRCMSFICQGMLGAGIMARAVSGTWRWGFLEWASRRAPEGPLVAHVWPEFLTCGMSVCLSYGKPPFTATQKHVTVEMTPENYTCTLHIAEWKKAVWEGHISNESNCMTFWKRKIKEAVKRSEVVRGVKGRMARLEHRGCSGQGNGSVWRYMYVLCDMYNVDTCRHTGTPHFTALPFIAFCVATLHGASLLASFSQSFADFVPGVTFW